MSIILYFIAIVISLFILYAVARHDFVLLRQSISLRQVFDNVFISLFVFFIASRIFYAFYIQKIQLLNPLNFFYLTKYWGILPYAGLGGVILSLLFLFRKKKNKFRILDIYFISFSPIILLNVLLYSNNGILLLIKIISILVLLSFYGWFIKIHNKFSTKDGFITCMTIITYSLVTLAFSLATNGIFPQKYLWFNAFLVIALIASSVLLIFVQKDAFNKQK
jgi:hypothetical protein